MNNTCVILDSISKVYGELPVLNQVSLRLEIGKTYCLMGPSGSGKTTLLRILLGLEQADGGTIEFPDVKQYSGIVAVFQENRLCSSFSALENIRMVTNPAMKESHVLEELKRLLPEESILRPVHTLSGGMKRRVAIVRALLAPSYAICMDEPFTGLDEDTKQIVIDYIKEKSAGRLLLVTTHEEDDIAALSGELITLNTAKQDLYQR